MDSSVSPKDEIWFLCVCHHISPGLYEGKVDVPVMSHTRVSLLLQISFQLVEGFSECPYEPGGSTGQVHVVVLPSDVVPKGNMVST